MKKIISGSVALLAMGLAGSAVRAADMPLKAPPPIPVYSWTGCYIGLDAGESYGHTDGYSTTSTSTIGGIVPIANVGAASGSFNLSGGIGGVYAGCNYQAGAFVFGVEADGQFTNKEGQAFTANPLVFPTTAIWSLKERWMTTARARLGYAWTPNLLLYVTGGGAWAKLDSAEWISPVPQGTAFLQSDWRGGWTVGAGAEYAVGYGWSVRSEFLYVDLGRYTTFTGFCPLAQCGGAPTNLSVNLHDYIYRFGMSYKFGWSPAVVARY